MAFENFDKTVLAKRAAEHAASQQLGFWDKFLLWAKGYYDNSLGAPLEDNNDSVDHLTDNYDIYGFHSDLDHTDMNYHRHYGIYDWDD